ncbi:MAG TPA: chromosomal replication initiator protein DnaA [Spirochaetia bacterium]|nr:chromosomal replication initiator protein DnaA [Spirochaetia bacterium]
MEGGKRGYEAFWKEALADISADLSEQEFATWFRGIEFTGSGDSHILLSAPSSFIKDQFSQRYLGKLEEKLTDLAGQKLSIRFSIQKKTSSRGPHEESPRGQRSEEGGTRKRQHPNLNKEYTFERFIIGESNSFAANAALAIARNPGTGYNPCLIYGGVGLGKTHLIQAIGNSVYREFPDLKVGYVTAEAFANEFILSIQKKTGHQFKNRYRSVDVLLIDDVHFLEGKEGTQEELFHTFNALYDANKQMVFTSDRPVSEIRSLSDRLRSRFERGLNVDLQPPNYETRIAILNRKIEEKKVKIPDEVVQLICRNVNTNVRDLEKALTKLIAYAELVNKHITLEISRQQLKDFFTQPNQKNITIELIQKIVGDYFGLSYKDLRGKRRTKAVAFPRQVAMYLSRELTEYSTTEVGAEFGGRDHTTVMHACQKIEDRMKLDPNLEPTMQALVKKIKENNA